MKPIILSIVIISVLWGTNSFAQQSSKPEPRMEEQQKHQLYAGSEDANNMKRVSKKSRRLKAGENIMGVGFKYFAPIVILFVPVVVIGGAVVLWGALTPVSPSERVSNSPSNQKPIKWE